MGPKHGLNIFDIIGNAVFSQESNNGKEYVFFKTNTHMGSKIYRNPFSEGLSCADDG